MEKKTKIYEFDQNNSGGSYDINESAGIGVRVYIEAYNADQANDHAERIGLYFNGVENGSDCECCGDRWYPTSEGKWGVYENKEELENHPYAAGGYLHSLDGSFVEIKKKD